MKKLDRNLREIIKILLAEIEATDETIEEFAHLASIEPKKVRDYLYKEEILTQQELGRLLFYMNEAYLKHFAAKHGL